MKNNKLKLAVAGAVLAVSASAANAGIVIPAGDWTLDVSGNVNMYATWAKFSGATPIIGGLSGTTSPSSLQKSNMSFTNGLLPNFLSFSGSTRQNDLDVAFTISLQPGSQNSSALNQVGSANNGGLNNRQAFITVGDKSWGSVKIGKDLGIFASDAILSDITLLGVGGTYGSSVSAGNTTLGRIGSGYIYADWKPQISYTTPNFSGFQATVGISQAFKANTTTSAWTTSGIAGSYSLQSRAKNSNVAYEGKASYTFASGDVNGKIWVSGIAQHVGDLTGVDAGNGYVSVSGDIHNNDPTAYAGDIGANVKVAGFDLTGYYYNGKGIGSTGQFLNGYGWGSSGVEARDSYGGYVQGIYTLPTKTRVALSWGISSLDTTGHDYQDYMLKSNEQYNAMVIHPLTKHLNLVGEVSRLRSKNQEGNQNQTTAGSVGAILFF